MATARPWIVLGHKTLNRHEDNLWSLEGKIPDMALRRRMTLARMHDGQVVVHNAVCVEEPIMNEIEAWGEPTVIVVPSAWHRLDAHAWKQRYPKARVVCPPGARKSVEKIVAVQETYDQWKGDNTVRLETLNGISGAEGVMTVSHDDRSSAVFNDILFNTPHLRGMAGWVMHHVTDSTGGPKISRIARWFVIKDQSALRQGFHNVADAGGLVRVFPGHGDVIESEASTVLRGVSDALIRT
jgi:hypothetical protein